MQYVKPPLSYEDQADLLISRGLNAAKEDLVSRLKAVNYYRLTAYLYPYRLPGSESFRQGTTLDLVWKHYTFDRQLRVLVMDAIERVEVAVRTKLVYCFAHRFGAFGYSDKLNFPKLENSRFQDWISDLKQEIERSRETFILHFKDKYGDSHDVPPLWMAAEIMSFGKMLTLFNGVEDQIRREIARDYALEDTILQSWLGTLNVIRNICAHHGRLWNRVLGYRPFFPRQRKYPQWHDPFAIPNDRIFAILTILRYLLGKIAPTSNWHNRFQELLNRYPEISTKPMGFPPGWGNHSIWKSS